MCYPLHFSTFTSLFYFWGVLDVLTSVGAVNHVLAVVAALSWKASEMQQLAEGELATLIKSIV